MVRALITFKIKQHNGFITEYKQQFVEGESYDKFIESIESEVDRLENKIGRTIRYEMGKIEGLKNQEEEEEEQNPEPNPVEELDSVFEYEKTSMDMLAKEAIKEIKSISNIIQLETFISEDEDRVTVEETYENKLNQLNKNKNNEKI